MAWRWRGGRLLHRAIVGGFEEDGLDFVGEFAVFFAFGAGLGPIGVLAELIPGGFRSFAGVVLEEVDKGVGVGGGIHGNAVDDVLHAVLFEDLGGVVSEAGIEVAEFAGGGDVGAEFIDMVLGGGAGTGCVAEGEDGGEAESVRNEIFHASYRTQPGLICC